VQIRLWKEGHSHKIMRKKSDTDDSPFKNSLHAPDPAETIITLRSPLYIKGKWKSGSIAGATQQMHGFWLCDEAVPRRTRIKYFKCSQISGANIIAALTIQCGYLNQ
jgi:hypothetical protein